MPASAADLRALGIGIARVAPRVPGGRRRVLPDEGFRFNPAIAFRRGGLGQLTGARRREARKVITGRGGLRVTPTRRPRPAAPTRPTPPRPRRAARPEKAAQAFVPRPPPTESEALRGRTFEVVESVNQFGKTIFTATIDGQPRGKRFRRRFAAERQLESFKQQLVDRALREHKEAEKLRREFESDPEAFRQRPFDFEL